MITVREGKLSAHIVATPLRQVMAAIRSLSGAQVHWSNEEEEDLVSVEFNNLSVGEALRHILAEKNFLLLYSSFHGEERLTQVWISSDRHNGAQSQNPTQGQEVDLEDQEGKLSESLNTLMQIALNDQDPATRRESVGHLEGYAEENPQAEVFLSYLAHHARDPQVQAAALAALTRRQQ